MQTLDIYLAVLFHDAGNGFVEHVGLVLTCAGGHLNGLHVVGTDFHTHLLSGQLEVFNLLYGLLVVVARNKREREGAESRQPYECFIEIFHNFFVLSVSEMDGH